MLSNPFAMRGGKKVVTIPKPHVIRPPAFTYEEQEEFSHVRAVGASRAYIDTTRTQLEDGLKALLHTHVKYCSVLPSVYELFSTCATILDLGAGDNVVCSALGAQEMFQCFDENELNYKLYYPDSRSGTCDEQSICAMISHDTRLVVISHHRGLIQSTSLLSERCRQVGAILLEDCSEIIGVDTAFRPQLDEHRVQYVSLGTSGLLFSGMGVGCMTNNMLFYECIQQYFSPEKKKEVEYLGAYRPHGLSQTIHPIFAKHALRNCTATIRGSIECYTYMRSRMESIGYCTFLEGPDPSAILPRYRFVLQYSPDKLQSVSVFTLVRLLRSEGVQCTQGSDLYEWHHSTINGFDSSYTRALEYLIFLPPFYDPNIHKDTINQYVAAFRKVQLNLFS